MEIPKNRSYRDQNVRNIAFNVAKTAIEIEQLLGIVGKITSHVFCIQLVFQIQL